jgi:putative toxin-antitoxin system antitoxin component (TIGR02293 family)
MPTRRKLPDKLVRLEPAATALHVAEPAAAWLPANAHRGVLPVPYRHADGVDDFVHHMGAATPSELVQTERAGVPAAFVKDLAQTLQMPVSRLYAMIGLPKATAERKAAAGDAIAGSPGLAALGVARLLGMAHDIVADSTAAEAPDFDTGAWLGRWLQRPQPSLGGLAPSDIVDTPTGVQVVARLLGALQSGAYQ